VLTGADMICTAAI